MAKFHDPSDEDLRKFELFRLSAEV